jgi:flagellar biosynthesis repressor protein FlbT
MKNPFKVSLKANEKIYVNGAVLRFDRRTSVEFLNDVNFLLEAHVMQLEDAVSPLQQLYYVIQIMLMSPENALMSKAVYTQHLTLFRAFSGDGDAAEQIEAVDRLVGAGKYYDAMKSIRRIDASITARRKAGLGQRMDDAAQVSTAAA